MDKVNIAELPLSNLPLEVLAHCPATTTCLPITVMPIAGEAELADHTLPVTRLLVAQQGTGRRWYQRDGRTRQLLTRPRMIEIYEKDLHFDHCRWEGEAGRTVVIEFEDSNVQALTHGDLQSLRLRTRHEWFDERVSRTSLELAKEVLQGLPSGLLYAQGLSIGLLGLLQRDYVDVGTPPGLRQDGILGASQRQRLDALIRGGLASDLSLSRLADEAGLSVYHFVRVFKNTFGTTPHRYVQDRRLDAAVTALQRDHRRSIADIAIACGFASQAHMTELMRRRLNVTPRALKQGR